MAILLPTVGFASVIFLVGGFAVLTLELAMTVRVFTLFRIVATLLCRAFTLWHQRHAEQDGEQKLLHLFLSPLRRCGVVVLL